MKCESCKFWEEKPKEAREPGEPRWGMCRRYPPTPIAVEDVEKDSRPQMAPGDWCGEYAPNKVSLM